VNPDGSFAYTPAANFYGTDTFTYRVTDGTTTSNVATASVTVAPTQCGPRPQVMTAPATAAGKLQVHLPTSPLSTRQNNFLLTLTFGTLTNAKVTANGQTIASGQTITLPANSTSLDFTVERVTPGQAVTVAYTVLDSCGSWPSFVGGGAGATGF